MIHELPKLKYSYTDLEPHIDALTMEIHYSKHHQTYVNKLNEALEKHPELSDMSVESLLQKLESIPEDIRIAVRNNGGGHFNHSLYWELMNPTPKIMPEGDLLSAINKEYEAIEAFKDIFNTEALNRFGSGWAWLAVDKNGSLKVYSTPNQDNPLMLGETPILALDVWEHAYYLKHQNKRAEYIASWWNIVDWAVVEKMYRETL